MSLGEKIQQLRKARGLSQEQLADDLNVSRQAVSKWETDQSSPEIDKLLAISKIFSISTDELLQNDIADNTGTSMIQSREVKKRLFGIVSWVRDLFNFMDSKIIFMIFTLFCFIAVGICIIVNYAIDQQITWAAYPILSVPFGWAVLSPLFAKKHGILLLLCALTLLTLPYLYLISKITPVTDWFIPLGMPSAIAGMIALWILYPLYRFAKMNILYKSAISVFLLGVISSSVVNYFVDIYLEVEPFTWHRYFSIFTCIIASAVLGILGYMKSKSKNCATS